MARLEEMVQQRLQEQREYLEQAMVQALQQAQQQLQQPAAPLVGHEEEEQEQQQQQQPVRADADAFFTQCSHHDLRRMHAALQQVVGPGAQFRDGQAAALYIMWKGTGSVLLALPTGAGKNLLYCVLSKLCPDKVVIIIVPLKALMADMLRRCRAYAGVTTHTWDDVRKDWPTDNLQAFRGLVLVQAEHVDTPDFQGFVGQLVTNQSMLQLVGADEGHLNATQGPTFRFGLIRGLARLPRGARRIATTATAPPAIVERLEVHLLEGQPFGHVLRRAPLPAHLRFEVRFLLFGFGFWRAGAPVV
jgi:superfamily II DNA helicase RecQ